MVLCIIALLVFIAGIILSDHYYDSDWFLYGLVGCLCVFLIGMVVSSLPIMYNVNTETKELVAWNDGVYYKDNTDDNTLTFCVIDNEKVSHQETIEYNDLNIEYIANTDTGMTTIKTYQIKSKLKYIIFPDILDGQNFDVVLQLPESARN